jgi:REP element-mobilizing transposase RayT
MRSKPCLIGDTARRLQELIREKAEALGVTVDHMAVLPDRVYIAIQAPPILSPHRIICGIKAHSSHCLRHEFQEMTKIPTVWTRAYLVLVGEHMTPDEALSAYEAAMPPRRPRGRPRSCDARD